MIRLKKIIGVISGMVIKMKLCILFVLLIVVVL